MKIVFTGTFQLLSNVGFRTEVAKRLPVGEIYNLVEPARSEKAVYLIRLYLCSVYVTKCQGTQILIYLINAL